MRLTALAGLMFIGAAPAAAQTAEQPRMVLYPAAEIQWKEGPATFTKGTQMAVLEGDPARPGPFTMRLKFPAGFRVSPHFHADTEHATVISGALYLGMGPTFDRKAMKELPAGSFGFWMAGTPHFAWFETETVLQVHGQGPWKLTYVNPADDPRKPAP